MSEGSPSIARIDAALHRIEVAAARLGERNTSLARRHATLRTTMTDAVAALDALIDDRDPTDRGTPA